MINDRQVMKLTSRQVKLPSRGSNRAFAGGSVVKNLLASVGDQEGPHAVKQLSPYVTTIDPRI